MALQQHRTLDDALAWLRARGARQLASDSRRIAGGEAFIAWPGHATDGRRFVAEALRAGAAACLVEAEGAQVYGFDDERVAALAGLKAATGPLASRFEGEPSERLDVLAVTGTNGKTSTAWWLAQALGLLGRRCGLVGTLGIGEPSTLVSTGLTTPDPVALQQGLRRFADAGFTACALEASSIGLEEERLAGTRIAVALFTNLTQDHLDYHHSMDAYRAAKARLFAWPRLRAAVVNVDDPAGAGIAHGLDADRLDVWTCSSRRPARLQARDLRHEHGLCFSVHEDADVAQVRTGLVGDYNADNLLAVIGGLRALGVSLDDAAEVCGRLTPVPGRMQRVPGGADAPAVVVDYAHTPDALEQVLRALRALARERGGRLWCVFGCGGNRDAGKRPLMGAVAERLADEVVLTSDNPRHEAPEAILTQIAAGLAQPGRAPQIVDRHAAIEHAVLQADARDVVLLAGKGHEQEQEIAGVKRPFSDAAEAAAALQRRGGRP